ncbi:hypothetical protein L596_010335 [Steinernema carpocapsae]|uniref:Uncharacterized protein n=1 Tax=Steinernema carpocapsae TaxID=34508 RepID=A0A4U5PI28_STECR|nr:hypothetical protein L596_010335 [Steinernema carpocapsae]
MRPSRRVFWPGGFPIGLPGIHKRPGSRPMELPPKTIPFLEKEAVWIRPQDSSWPSFRELSCSVEGVPGHQGRRRHKIAFYLNGVVLNYTFNGTEIDLLQHYSNLVLAYEAAKFGSTIFETVNRSTTPWLRRKLLRFTLHYRLRSWMGVCYRMEACPILLEHMILDLLIQRSVTLFHDVIFAGERIFDVVTRAKAVNIDPRFAYTEGNHFDLTNWTSVNEQDKNKTLIGVVDGMKVCHKECAWKEDVIISTSCKSKKCKYADVVSTEFCCFSIK